MGFQWFRDLKEMRSISPEKLQKNIFQQTTYVGMYTSDLMNEVRRFDVARLLRYTCVHRNSLGTDSFNALTTDCLLVFLHGMSFSNTVSWKPSDEETAVIGKGVRNLHRLIGEHLKAVIRYIEYSVLLKVANNEIAFDEAEKEREDLFLSLIPKKGKN